MNKNKAAEKPAEVAAAPDPAPETEKQRRRREEDTLDTLVEFIPANESGLSFGEIPPLGLDDFALQQALDALEAQGHVSRVTQNNILAYRREK